MEENFLISDLENVLHMVGAGYRNRSKSCYRNHFAPGGDDIHSMERLEKAGLVIRGNEFHNSNYFHANKKVLELLGFSKKKIRAARESANIPKDVFDK